MDRKILKGQPKGLLNGKANTPFSAFYCSFSVQNMVPVKNNINKLYQFG